jgi:hypothetical protein
MLFTCVFGHLGVNEDNGQSNVVIFNVVRVFDLLGKTNVMRVSSFQH